MNIFLLLVWAMAAIQANSEEKPETITIYGNHSSVQNHLGLSTYIIDQNQISLKNASSVADYLKDVPGIFVQRSGGPGGQLGIFVRGARQDQLIVTIDGTPVSDPALSGAGYDLSHMSIADVEAIEIYKGAQSVMFGSDGLGGVINIVTIKGRARSKVYLEGGNNQQVRVGASTSGNSGALSYRVNGEQFSIQSGSDASANEGNTENDPYLRRQFSGYLNYQVDSFYSALTIQKTTTDKDLDSFGDDYTFVDDPNFSAKGDQVNSKLALGNRWLNMDWAIDLSQTNIVRRYEDQIDETHSTEQSAKYRGVQNQGGLTLSTNISDEQSIVSGLQFKTEKAIVDTTYGGLDQEDDSKGLFLNYTNQVSESINVQIGARRDDINRAGIEDTGSIKLEMQLDHGALYSIVNRAFKSPTLFQSFDPSYGNSELKSERAKSYELGYKLNLGIAYFDVSVFQNEFINIIDYDFATNKYTNLLGMNTTRGSEFQVGHTWLGKHNLELSGSYLDMTKNEKPLLRRARNTYRAQYTYTLSEYNIGSSYQWIGKRADFSGDLAAFENVDLFASWKMEGFRLYTRIENLLNRSFTQVSGYSPSYRQGLLGAEFSF